MCHRFVKIKMRWFVGLLMGLGFHSGFFTAAQTDLSAAYRSSIPSAIVTFSKPVPIEAGDVTVNVGGVANLQSANPVLVTENTDTDPSQYLINATYGELMLYSFCRGQEPTGDAYDCFVSIKNVNYIVTFQKKEGEYKAVGGHGEITNKSFEPTAFTSTKMPSEKELIDAFKAELMAPDEPPAMVVMSLADPPSELLMALEALLDSSLVAVLP